MSYTYLQDQGEESLAATFSDIPQSALSRLSHIAERSCCNVSATECFQDFQSGTMSQHSTATRGEGGLMSSAEDSHAKTSVSQGGGAGLSGNRSGLWSEMARIICEVRPKFVFVENSPMLAVRGLDRVLGDLSELGYNARWGCVSAANAGLPHPRDRMWILSYPKGLDLQEPKVVDQERISREFRGTANGGGVCQPGWEMYQPDMARMDDGVGTWVGRSKAIGNGQVPRVAALAWRLLIPSFVNSNPTV
jgi:hypothetical protein